MFSKSLSRCVNVALQVGVVQEGVQGGTFRVLSTPEVDEHLTALSERD